MTAAGIVSVVPPVSPWLTIVGPAPQDHGTDGHVCACPECTVCVTELSYELTRLTYVAGYVLWTPFSLAWVLMTTCSRIRVRSRSNSTNGDATISASSNLR
jgi:hypothetical protein